MAYGLKIYDEDGNLTFNSETSFGFIEITSFSVSTDGTTGNSASGTLPGYTAIFPVYVPTNLEDDEPSTNTKRPVLAQTFNSSTGAWSVTQTWAGTNTGNACLRGGRVIVFAH